MSRVRKQPSPALTIQRWRQATVHPDNHPPCVFRSQLPLRSCCLQQALLRLPPLGDSTMVACRWSRRRPARRPRRSTQYSGTDLGTYREILTDPLSFRLNQRTPLSKPISLGSADTLKLGLTAKDNGKGKRPHQAFLVLQEQESGLEAPFPLTVKESGKAAVQIVRTLLGHVGDTSS